MKTVVIRPSLCLLAALTLLLASLSLAFSPSASVANNAKPTTTSVFRLQAVAVPAPISTVPNAINLKAMLLQKIMELRELQKRDGDVVIDWGSKGGELDKDSRTPQKVNYYSISRDVGSKADEIVSICKWLSKVSPTKEPTKYLGDKENGHLAALNGPWKLLFTTAADASFSKNSTRGSARAQNVVNATRGIITNIIDFDDKEDGTEPTLKQLNVVIKAKAQGPKRVALNFRYAKAVFTKLFFWKVRWSLYIPVPAAFITRCIVLFSRLFRFGRKSTKKIPKAYFDVLYLDEDLRVHQTGEDNIFVQAKEGWSAAKPFLM
jgi:hypothetical protein